MAGYRRRRTYDAHVQPKSTTTFTKLGTPRVGDHGDPHSAESNQSTPP